MIHMRHYCVIGKISEVISQIKVQLYKGWRLFVMSALSCLIFKCLIHPLLLGLESLCNLMQFFTIQITLIRIN